jgi:hypothetical protein
MLVRSRAVHGVALLSVTVLLTGVAYAVPAAHRSGGHHRHHRGGHQQHHHHARHWHAPDPTRRELRKGLVVHKRYDHKIKSFVRYASVHPGAHVRFRAVPAAVPLADHDLDRTSTMCRRVHCIVAVNGSFRDIPSTLPRGGEIVGGVPIRLRATEKGQAVLSRRRPVDVRTLHTDIRLRQRGVRDLHIRGVNVVPESSGLKLFTGHYAPRTPRGVTLPLAFTRPRTFRLGHTYRVDPGALRAHATRAIVPRDGVVLLGRGHGAYRLRNFLRHADPTKPIRLTSDVGPQDVRQSLGTSFRLLHNGKIVAPKRRWHFIHGNNPRTVLAWKKDGTALLITVDGRRKHSRGISLKSAAKLARRLGATDAVNLDGGGSTTFVVHGKVRNSPSDGHERGVVNAIALVPSHGHGYDPGYYPRMRAQHAAQRRHERKAAEEEPEPETPVTWLRRII